MKKFLLATIITASMFFSATAQTAGANQNAISNFDKVFSTASNVQWLVGENFTKAVFTEDGRQFEAFYDALGDFIGTMSYIKIDDLPIFATRIIDRKYGDYKIKEAFELVSDNNTVYFISAENTSDKIVLKVENGSVSVYNKTAKVSDLSLK